MKKLFIWLLIVVFVGSIAGMGIGCKEVEEATTEEAVAEEEEEAEEVPTEEAVAEEEEEAEETPELGTESSTYWIEKAGITPSGELNIYSYKDVGTTEWEITQKFMEMYPDVNVNWVAIPSGDYESKIAIELETGTSAFDLFWCSEFKAILFKDYLEDVTERIPEELKNDIVEGSITGTGFEGKWFGIPLFLCIYGIGYNKDILQQAGYDALPETWDEFIKYAQDATIDEDNDGIPEIHGYTSCCSSRAQLIVYGSILKSVGGQFWNEDGSDPQPTFDDEHGRRALEILKQLYVSDFSDPVMATGDNVAVRRSLASGLVAVGLNPMGSVFAIANKDFPENKEKLDWALIPHDPGYESYGINGSSGFAIRKGGNVDAALAFVLFTASPEIQMFETENYGFSTVRKSLVGNEEYIAKFPYVPAAIKQGENMAGYQQPNSAELGSLIKPIWDRYYADEIDIEETIIQMEEAFDAAWEE